MTAPFVWNVDPIIARFGPVVLRYYGICFVLALGTGFAVWYHRVRRFGESVEFAEQWPLWGVPAVFVGGRLGFCFFYQPSVFNSEILGRPASVPWAVVFARHDPVPRHPAQLYDMLIGPITYLVLREVERRPSHHGLMTAGAPALDHFFGFVLSGCGGRVPRRNSISSGFTTSVRSMCGRWPA